MINKIGQEKLGNILYDVCPYATVICDADFNVTNANRAALKLFEFPDEESLIYGIADLFQNGMPAFQSNAAPTIPIRKRLEYTEKNGSIDFEAEIVISTRRLHLKINFTRVDVDSTFIIIGNFVDIQDLRQARGDLFKQEYLLRQINRVATLLSGASAEVMETSIESVMKITAETVDADVISIYKNSTDTDAKSCVMVASWASGYFDQFTKKINYDDITDFYNKLHKNRSINKTVKELSETESKLFATAGTKSILIIPIFIFGDFWGILFLENRKNDSIYNRSEVSAIQSAGILIVSALLRNETSQQLILAKDEAQASGRAKMDFLSRMSHEIRTPLNAIIGMTAIAKRDIKEKDAQEKLNKIEFASSQLLHIINDILDMSKIESGKIEMSLVEFDFNELMDNVFAMMRVQSDAKNQKLIYDIPDFDRQIYCDDLHLRQIIVNLLSNAIKFTPDGGTVKVTVTYKNIDDLNYVLDVHVIDTGIGMTPSQQSKLFTSFEQADGGIARKYGGTGLGLAISKRLSVLMGGDIGVKSEIDKGSDFYFHIPFTFGESIDKSNKKTIENTPDDFEYNWADKKILLVEDTDINREIIIEILRDTNVTIDIAENGKIAVDMFTKNPEKYNLVLMDVQMPEMDGLEATRRIRATDVLEAKTLPIVAMTANAFSGDVANCLNAGMNDHIAKPIDVEILFKKIAKYI